jgi:hypothetical protein
MEGSRSTRSSSRARTTERGFALAMALIIAVLYFGLIELMLFDASRELGEARRFRARILALTLAENGAELAAAHMALPDFDASGIQVEATDWQGTITGKLMKDASTGKFDIKGTGEASGVVAARATVKVYGVVDGTKVKIYNTDHTTETGK